MNEARKDFVDLSGQIERVTFTSEESGYTIAKVKVYGRRELVTVVGNILCPTPGEIIKMKGEWSNHPKFGEQFKLAYYMSGSPLIQGLADKVFGGKQLAEVSKMIDAGGGDMFDVLA